MLSDEDNLIHSALTTPNPFKAGDQVMCIETSGTWFSKDTIYTVSRVSAGGSDIFVDEDGWGWAHTRFVHANSVDEIVTDDKGAFVKKFAKELERAIDRGTMAGYYSALGFVTELLSEYESLTKE